MNDTQLPEKTSVLPSDSIKDVADSSASISVSRFSGSNLTKEELLAMALTIASNERQQIRDKLAKNPKNKLALKDRSYWYEQLDHIFKYIGEIGQTPESIQISAETDENKVVVQQKGKTTSFFIVAVLLFVIALIAGICYSASQGNTGVSYFLCVILAFVVLALIVMYFLYNYEKRNR